MSYFKIVFVFSLLQLLPMQSSSTTIEKWLNKQNIERWIRIYPYVLTGSFTKKNPEKIIKDDIFPGGGYVVKKFKVDRVYKGEEVALNQLINVKIPLDVVHRKKYNFEKTLNDAVSFSDLCGEKNDAIDCEYSRKLTFRYSVLSNEKYSNYDYSLSFENKYLVVFEKPENNFFAFDRHPSKFVPLEKGLPIDLILKEID